MIRDAAQADEMRDLGAEPLVADLSGDVSDAPQGCDAVVYTAGAGAGSGAEKKQTVDRAGSDKLVDAATTARVDRYVMVSSMRADDPDAGSAQMRPYYEAKGQADACLRDSELDWTIVRPGRLTDERGSGRVAVAASLGEQGEVSRDNVADVIVSLLETGRASRQTFELLDGETDIDVALADLDEPSGQRS
jgi:uncharacterized protein YbjT (DUF2867 family)